MFQWLGQFFSKKRRRAAMHSVLARLPQAKPTPALVAEKGYFRVWLREMFLAVDQSWFVDQFPAIQGSVKLQYADHDEARFTRVTKPPEKCLATGVLVDYTLTPLVPFNGGTVEVEVNLYSIPGSNQVKAFLEALESFSELVTPPLSQVIPVASKVSAGLQSLVGATDAWIQLPYHQTFREGSGDNALQGGFLAVVNATASQVVPARLSVHDGRLHYAAKEGATPGPLTGHDYMLLEVETRETRDDWRSREITRALREARRAFRQGKKKEGKEFRAAAISAVLLSQDLIQSDQWLALDVIKEELKKVEAKGQGAEADEGRDLEALIKATDDKKREWARRQPKLTVEQAFAE